MLNAYSVEISSDEDEVSLVSISTALSSPSKPQHFWADTSKSKCIIAPWKPCQLIAKQCFTNENDEEEKSAIVRFGERKFELPEHKLALSIPANLHYGARVVAFRINADLPYIIDEQNKLIPIYPSLENEPYAGILAVPSEDGLSHLVFFDDGHVQRVDNDRIRLVLSDSLEYVHSNAKDYYEFYLSLLKHNEIRPKIRDVLSIELDGKWVHARTVEVDKVHPLAQFCFMRDEKPDRYEWLYLGSPRIEQIWRKMIEQKVLDKWLDFKFIEEYTNVNDDDGDCVMIDMCTREIRASRRTQQAPVLAPDGDKCAKNHKCTHYCVWREDKDRIERYSLFHRPLAVGFERCEEKNSRPSYWGPCGRKLSTYNDIQTYLTNTDSKLRIDSFSLERKFNPSENRQLNSRRVEEILNEKLPISVCDGILDADKFDYITEYQFPEYIELQKNVIRCCECTDNCLDKLKCSCWRSTIEKYIERPPTPDDLEKHKSFGYTQNRLMKGMTSQLVECGSECACNADKCSNRVVQRGLQLKLELFDTGNRGRGVRTLTDLPSGTFVITYAGEIIDGQIAEKRENFSYFFTLGQHKRRTPPSQPTPKRARLDSEELTMKFLNFFPKVVPTWYDERVSVSESEPEENTETQQEFVIDSYLRGNISRYFNHSCRPNMFTQSVSIGTDERFPAIAFFTNCPVKAGTELTFDYQYDSNDDLKTKCLCRPNCTERLI